MLQPPFDAIDCSLDSALFPGPCLTLGGLRVDGLCGRALRADGSEIPGLYAAGRSAVGVASRSYVSGLSLADCVFSGRNAGRDAAERAARAGAGLRS
ncbi:MAG: FAD-binding protein [Sandaracinaceae bacterium]|nr:FAD-binding protein [Sandaracinaceae bacterium]